MFSDPGKSVPKCSKVPDGAHFFEKKEELKTSPFVIHKRKGDYIVLKNGGPITTKIKRWERGLCHMKGDCFDGDDMDLYEIMIFQKQENVFNMSSGRRIRDCGFKSITRGVYKCHLMGLINYTNPSSIHIAKDLSNLWYSD